MAISSAGVAGLKPGVVDNAAARPASPFEGQMIFQKDTDQLLIWNGSAWVIPNQTTQNPEGLELITSGITATNGTVSNGIVTIGSAVSSVTVSGAFSSTYDHYLIQVSGGAVSTQNELRLQMSGTTSGYYYQLIYGTWSTGAISGEGSKTATEWLYTGMGATNGLVMNCQVYGPYLATRTRIVAPYFGFTGDVGHVHGQLDNATQYTDFVIKTSTGTMTGGTIRVYGYRKL
jgi:hypothetical protein